MKSECIFPMLLEKDKKLPLYIIGIGCDEYQKYINREEGLPYHQLAFCTDGLGKFCAGNREFVVDKGKAFYFAPNTAHRYYPLKEPWTTLWIVFSGAGADDLLEAMNLRQYEVFSIINLDESLIRYNRLFNTLSQKGSSHMPEASAILYSMLVNICRQMNAEDSYSQQSVSGKLERVLDYIKENYNTDISLKDMAEIAGVSTSYLCRIFKREFNLTPVAYLIRYRINLAKEILINNPDKSIKSIALETGFSDNSYFGALFREYEGCSPNQFRNLYSRP